MVIDVSKIAKTDGASLPVSGEVSLADQSYGALDVQFTGSVPVFGKVTNLGGIVCLDAQAEVKFRTACARCLKMVDVQLPVEIHERFSASAAKEDDDIFPLVHDNIYVNDVLEQNLFVALPLKVLCKEDCKGLCPVCGCDRNETDCDCELEDIDPRLAVLKDFLKD